MLDIGEGIGLGLQQSYILVNMLQVHFLIQVGFQLVGDLEDCSMSYLL